MARTGAGCKRLKAWNRNRPGQAPRHPSIHAVTGYGGNGITYSQVASEIVASAIEGRGDSDTAFSRSSVSKR